MLMGIDPEGQAAETDGTESGSYEIEGYWRRCDVADAGGGGEGVITPRYHQVSLSR